MARVILLRNLKWTGTHYPAGFAVDLPDDVLATLPDGTVRPLDTTVPVYVPPPPSDVSQPAQPPAYSFSPVIRPMQT